jgi:folate-binding protein YgfZ
MNTALQDALSSQAETANRSLRVADYRGANTAAVFSDPQTELSALRTGCGVFDMGFRSRIVLTGGDRQRWLNGMVTNNIRDQAQGHGVYAFLLNPQGRILGDLYAFIRADSVVVDTDHSQLEKILATFDHYIIMDDVNVASFADKLTALGIAGPKSRAVLQAAGIAIPDMLPLQAESAVCHGVECEIVRGEDPANESYEIWVASDRVYKLWQAMLAAGATPVGCDALEMQRIVLGIPLYGVDIRERDLPQETEQDRALNFNKGCYVGQEIVERIRSRGTVHRKFTGFIVESGGPVAPGAKINAGDKEVGEITSATSLHLAGSEGTLALGYIRREAGIPGREVTIGEAKAIVAQLPFDLTAAFRDEHSLATRV